MHGFEKASNSQVGVFRSVLICHQGYPFDQEGLSRWLASISSLAGVVLLEEGVQRGLQRVRRELRRSGLAGFLDVAAFRLFYRLFLAARDRAWEAEAVESMKRRFGPVPETARVLRATSPNAPEVIDFLRECRPDFMVARCKTLLKPEVFRIPTGGTYVLHPGICPEYRNAHGCFWALAQGDLERVGLTLLRIDEGVDTGPVYGYFAYPYDERRESHVVIQLRVLRENLDAVGARLLEAVAGTAAPVPVDGRESRTWGQPWLTAYLRWKARARRGARKGDVVRA